MIICFKFWSWFRKHNCISILLRIIIPIIIVPIITLKYIKHQICGKKWHISSEIWWLWKRWSLFQRIYLDELSSLSVVENTPYLKVEWLPQKLPKRERGWDYLWKKEDWQKREGWWKVKRGMSDFWYIYCPEYKVDMNSLTIS